MSSLVKKIFVNFGILENQKIKFKKISIYKIHNFYPKFNKFQKYSLFLTIPITIYIKNKNHENSKGSIYEFSIRIPFVF